MLAITAGEPAGIGPDLIVQLAQYADTRQWVLIADPEVIRQRARLLGLPISLAPWQPGDAEPKQGIKIIPVTVSKPVSPGLLAQENAQYVLQTLDLAIQGCQNHYFQGMVTCPVQKSVINDAGIPFSGHTEYLQQQCQVEQVVMMLSARTLRVALVTTHLPLRDIADAITPQSIESVIQITHNSLKKQFGIAHPRLLVCGLNPHAGESGHLGQEEIQIITPTLDKLRQQGLDLQGPLPADTLFTPKYLKHADAVIAMYHDQGLPVLKHVGFGSAVNITLGLPIIRTSVDHGTALDLAGTGKGDTGSLEAAIRTALNMARPKTGQT